MASFASPNIFKSPVSSAVLKKKSWMPATEFSSLTPPDVQNDTRIIAVVGIDNEDDAAPDNDGWFISDFSQASATLKSGSHA